MENIGIDRNNSDTEEKTHKSRCTECPAYGECMGVWLDYFAGKRNSV